MRGCLAEIAVFAVSAKTNKELWINSVENCHGESILVLYTKSEIHKKEVI